ncbi:uncharacterized protein LOC126686003 [Mercurialis annua]|uniref:uncharacterized protein LOC126686003 n=1 Tax=Mercurialis annua TaxID=3986 RepID=UPI00215E6681|nr:uncharacterized protein LOC126686003 [Mercurialis annua]
MIETSPNRTPKLSLSSFPNKPYQNHQQDKLAADLSSTPPISNRASIPFQWEEAPGKPRRKQNQSEKCKAVARCLDLPPRLTVLDSPSPSYAVVDDIEVYTRGNGKGRVMFGSGRWGRSKEITRKSSFLMINFSSSSKSHLLTNIYEGFKQVVVPWRRHRQRN